MESFDAEGGDEFSVVFSWVLDGSRVEIGCEVLWEEGEEAVDDVDLGICECDSCGGIRIMMDRSELGTSQKEPVPEYGQAIVRHGDDFTQSGQLDYFIAWPSFHLENQETLTCRVYC